MRTKQHFRKLVLFTGVAAALSACNNKKEPLFEVFADAYIIKKEIEGEERFATTFFAYGNKNIASATVTPPTGEGEPFDLEQTVQSSYTFAKEPAPGDFLTELPAAGDYQFDVVSTSGEAVQESDFLEIVNLEMPVITSAFFQSGNNTMLVNWETVTEADGIVVSLISNEGNTVFISNGLTSNTTEYNIGQETGNWVSNVSTGEELLLQVQVFAFETDAATGDNVYNIGGVAIGEMSITWGE